MTAVQPRVLARDVMRSACMVFDLPLEILTGRQRDLSTTRPRALTCRAIRVLCPHVSFPEIGRMMGGRDHTTIIKNVAKTDGVLRTQPALADGYRRLLEVAPVVSLATVDAAIAEAERRLADLNARRTALLCANPNTPGA